jgi:hypothetical protein
MLGYKVNGSAEMTDNALVRARSGSNRCGESPPESKVRGSSATVVSTAMCMPFLKSSRIRRLPWRCRSSTVLEQTMAMRKQEDEVFPNAAGIDVGGSSHWVALPRQRCDESVREFGAMTDDLHAMADWLLACGVDTVTLESIGGVLDSGVRGSGTTRSGGLSCGRSIAALKPRAAALGFAVMPTATPA